MTTCSFTALREKEVINLCDGHRLGYVCDLEFTLCDGRLTAIAVPGEGGFLCFGRPSRTVIPWEKIETIGNDAILVRLTPEECCPAPPRGKRC